MSEIIQRAEKAAEELETKLPGWDRLRCSECDSVVGFFSPEVTMHGEDLPVYCFQCASHLAVKDH